MEVVLYVCALISLCLSCCETLPVQQGFGAMVGTHGFLWLGATKVFTGNMWIDLNPLASQKSDKTPGAFCVQMLSRQAELF